MKNSLAYQNPVAQLLFLDEETDSTWEENKIDYVARFGFTIADVPELIRLSLDQDPPGEISETEDWMIHGVKAVTQLDPKSGIELYLQLLHMYPGDDRLHEDGNEICQRVGKIAIAPIIPVLADVTQDPWTRTTLAGGLAAIGQTHPECREACIQALIAQLRLYSSEQDDYCNSWLVNSLIRLKATESADLLAEVFANREIDEWLTGSWPMAQVVMGLKQESDFSKEELQATPPKAVKMIRENFDKLVYINKPIAVSKKPAGFGSTSKPAQKYKKKKR